ncbi:MAG: hypothetical protein ACTSQP_20380 [Promethearchaeota archaeon]
MFVKALPVLKIYIEILNRVMKVEMARYRVKSRRRKGIKLFKLTEKTFKRINIEFYKKLPPEILKTIQDLIDFSKNITNDISYIKEHKKEDFYNMLELAKDLHEFHIDFVKFILQLWHIYENGNSNYVNNYRINHKFPHINTIVNFYINKKLLNYCPFLSRVLCGFFLPFEKYRNIESHSTPQLKLSDDKKFVYIPKKGKKSNLKVNIDKFRTQIRTYISFIEALDIYR